jgi:hypothetical protein
MNSQEVILLLNDKQNHNNTTPNALSKIESILIFALICIVVMLNVIKTEEFRALHDCYQQVKQIYY